jgi:hypothetical protein
MVNAALLSCKSQFLAISASKVTLSQYNVTITVRDLDYRVKGRLQDRRAERGSKKA